MQQQHASFGAVALGGGAEERHQAHKRNFKAIDRVGLVDRRIGEEFEAVSFFFASMNSSKPYDMIIS
jgi:hypothetical protein